MFPSGWRVSINSKWIRLSIFAFVAVVLFNFTFFAYKPHIYTRFLPLGAGRQAPNSASPVTVVTTPLPFPSLTLPETLRALYEPLISPVDAPSYTSANGTRYNLTGDPVFTESLGRKLCIVDIDTRPFDGPDELMDPKKLDWNKFAHQGVGMLNHYTYTLIHGYTYKFIRTTPFPDRIAMWTKISALADTLGEEDCHITLSIDADATFMDLSLPFEWLLNRWGVTPGTSLTMPRDPDEPQNLDAARGNINLNCGFVIAQNLPRTQEILKAWASCPDDEIRFPNCSRWKSAWPAEQAAFGEYIRYEFDEPEDIREIECDEANGFPGSDGGCTGVFVRHHWTDKALVKAAMADVLAAATMARIHREFLNDEEVVVLRTENNFTSAADMGHHV